MDHKIRITLLLVICCCCFFTVQSTNSRDEENGGGSVWMDEEKKATLIEMVKSLLSFPTTFPRTSNYWVKVKSLIAQGQAYFSPPNLEKGEEPEVSAEGTGEKVKEAVVKSLDKSKTTLQDSAKSAAKVVGETANKVKKTLSRSSSDNNGEDEL